MKGAPFLGALLGCLIFGLIVLVFSLIVGCTPHVHHYPTDHYEGNCLMAFYYDDDGTLKGVEEKCESLVPHAPEKEKPNAKETPKSHKGLGLRTF